MRKILIFNKITNNKITKWVFEVLPQRAKTALRGSDRVASLAVEWNGVVWWCTPWRRDVPRVRCWYESSDLASSKGHRDRYVGSLFVMNQWCLSQWLVTVQKLLSVTVQKWKKYIFTFLHFYREILIWMGFWIKKEMWNVIL